MLDTSIVSSLIASPYGKARARVTRQGEASVCVSIVAAAELRFGIAKKGSAKLAAKVEAILGVLRVLPLEAPADTRYGELRAHLVAAGRTIGPNDLWIAAHALTLGLTLATANISEFKRIPGLTVENWLE